MLRIVCRAFLAFVVWYGVTGALASQGYPFAQVFLGVVALASAAGLAADCCIAALEKAEEQKN